MFKHAALPERRHVFFGFFCHRLMRHPLAQPMHYNASELGEPKPEYLRLLVVATGV